MTALNKSLFRQGRMVLITSALLMIGVAGGLYVQVRSASALHATAPTSGVQRATQPGIGPGVWSAAPSPVSSSVKSRTECVTSDRALLNNADLGGGYTVFLDGFNDPFTGGIGPNTSVAATSFQNERTITLLNNQTLSGPIRQSFDQYAQQHYGYAPGKWPTFPFVGPGVNEIQGPLDVNLSNLSFDSAAGVRDDMQFAAISHDTAPYQKYFPVELGDQAEGREFDPPAPTSQNPGPFSTEYTVSVQLDASEIMVSVGGGPSVTPEVAIAMAAQAIKKLQGVCGGLV